jgi:hypothetical protein
MTSNSYIFRVTLFIICLSGLASCRRPRLTSNVRRRSMQMMRCLAIPAIVEESVYCAQKRRTVAEVQ